MKAWLAPAPPKVTGGWRLKVARERERTYSAVMKASPTAETRTVVSSTATME